MTVLSVPYPDGYIEQCFTIWYSAGRPSISQKFINTLPDIDGRRPIANVLRHWIVDKGWKERADELDGKARQIVNVKLVNQKAKMLERQAIHAVKVQEKALEALMKGFDSSASAVQGWRYAIEVERSAVGLNENLKRLGNMTDDELRKYVRELAERENVDVIDTVETEENE